MRSLMIVTSAVLVLAGLGGAQEDTGVESAIDALASKYEEGWAAGDASMCASIYTEDADTVDLSGRSFEGRAAIQENIAETLGMYGDSTISIERTSIHEVTPDIVVSDGTWEVQGSSAEDVPMSGFYTIIATNEGGEWLITSGRAKVAPPVPGQ